MHLKLSGRQRGHDRERWRFRRWCFKMAAGGAVPGVGADSSGEIGLVFQDSDALRPRWSVLARPLQ